MQREIRSALDEVKNLLDRFISLPGTVAEIEEIAIIISSVFENEGTIFVCGNGGSMCDAQHFAEELTGRFRKDRTPLPAIALSDVAHITCTANDFGFDEIFARSLEALGKPKDLLVAISTSGNSRNIIRAVETAVAKNMKVFGLLGKDGGRVKKLTDFSLVVPGETSDRIQELHMVILHILVEIVERMIFPENYA